MRLRDSLVAGAALLALAAVVHAQTVTSPSNYPGVRSQSNPSSPTGTTSTSGVMMGLAVTFTPTTTGRVLVIVGGYVFNSTASDGAIYIDKYGTGVAPGNGVAPTGTTASGSFQINGGNANQTTSVAHGTLITGLTLGTTYWFDIDLAAVTGGTATIGNPQVTIIEL